MTLVIADGVPQTRRPKALVSVVTLNNMSTFDDRTVLSILNQVSILIVFSLTFVVVDRL